MIIILFNALKETEISALKPCSLKHIPPLHESPRTHTGGSGVLTGKLIYFIVKSREADRPPERHGVLTFGRQIIRATAGFGLGLVRLEFCRSNV